MKEILEKLNYYYVALLESIPRIGMAILILVIGILIANWLTSLARKQINARSEDKLMSSFLSKAVKLVLIIIVSLLTLNIAGFGKISAALLATFGASAVVLGFAFKDIAQNFLAGIILAFNRPFNLNDAVQIENVFGKIMKMEFRYTKIVTFDGRRVYIPNSDVLTKPVFNYTEAGAYRTDFILGIDYGDDSKKAKEIIQRSLDTNPNLIHDDSHVNFVVEDEVASSTVNLKSYIWISTEDFRRGMLEIRGEAIANAKKALEENGFSLPSEIRELKFYNTSTPFKLESFPVDGDAKGKSTPQS